MSASQEETLTRLLSNLKSSEHQVRLAALAELGQLNYSSPAVLKQVEQIALHDSSGEARAAAISLLNSRVYRYIREQTSTVPRNLRAALLKEIDAWQADGLIEPGQADVLRGRYDFSAAAVKPSPLPLDNSANQASAATAPGASRSKPASASPAPTATLTERLLSQATINVFLYLGAFLVIGAALILAALVQAARLPILLGVTLIFGATSLSTKKQLPQPSFALFIVFSFLLPILSGVVADSLNLSERSGNLYWAVMYGLMALIWGFATWFYSSRVFSVATLGSLGLAVLFLNRAMKVPFDQAVFDMLLVVGACLLAAFRLKRWKGSKFTIPLFICTQMILAAVLIVSLASCLIHISDSDAGAWDWVAITLTWLGAASLYAFSDLLFPSGILFWIATGCLLPTSWMILQIFGASDTQQIIGLLVWGALLALSSEFLIHRKEHRLTSFNLPFLFGSFGIFGIAALWGTSQSDYYEFAVLLSASVVYTVLHVIRQRGWLWLIALASSLGAYLVFFQLPFMSGVSVGLGPKFLAASLFLLTPELFFKVPLSAKHAWRWPPFILGIFVTLINICLSLVTFDSSGVSAIALTVYSLLFAAYALHFRRPRLGFLATTSAAWALFFMRANFGFEPWLPLFTGLSAIYFGAGYLLRRDSKTGPWAAMLRWSGLVLGTIVSLAAVYFLEDTGGWYVLLIGALFEIETFLQSDDRLESSGPLVFSLASFLILHHFHVKGLPYHLLSISLIWLVIDVVYARTRPARKSGLLIRLVGAVVAGGNALFLLTPGVDAKQAAVCYGVYALCFAAYAWYLQKPTWGYAGAISLPLSIVFTLRSLHQDHWLLEIAALAVLYYVTGYTLRRRGIAAGWRQMLLFSSLGIGTINALSAPLQSGLSASIPVAVAATLFAAEAFARRNVWLGFPANLLYLEAYFLLLFRLQVDQPQFFSVGTAVLGLLMHYLLTRAGSKTGAFLTGMFSQLVLLGTTYIQMWSSEILIYFVVVFFQGLAVLAYGILIRSRSLVITPIAFIVLSVFTIVYGMLQGISTVILIGCTGLLLLMFGILAVILRERIRGLGERFSGWQS